MSHDTKTRNLRDGIIIAQDGNATNQQSQEFDIEQGNLSFTIKRAARIIKDRGALSHRRAGDEEACEISFSVYLCKFKAESGEDPSLYDCLTGTGEASGWTSTSETGEPFTADLVFKIINPDADGNREVFTFADFHADELEVTEGEEADVVTATGTALVVEPTVSHEAQS